MKMANENKFEEIIKTSLENIKGMLDSNTIIGNPIDTVSGTTIIPISKISVGFATGGLDSSGKKDEITQNKKPAKFGGGGGSGMNITPVGFIVVDKNGNAEFLNIKGKVANDPIEQISDLIERSPEIIEKIKNIFKKNDSVDQDVIVEETVTEE